MGVTGVAAGTQSLTHARPPEYHDRARAGVPSGEDRVMPQAMSKRERVQAAIAGEPVDRVPVSFWGHDFAREWSAEGLADWTLELHRTYDWDFVKINPRATYYAEDWGCVFQPSGDRYVQPRLTSFPIKTVADWSKLRELDPSRGAYGQQLESIRLVKAGLDDDAPVIQTVFSPLSVAVSLAGSHGALLKTLREQPTALHEALAVIARGLARYARLCLVAGADGVLFATTTVGTYERLTEAEYREFGRPYDLQVLAAVQDGATFNVLHVCRDRCMFDVVQDYPVHTISWASTSAGNPSLAEGKDRTAKAVMGGVSHTDQLVNGPREAILAEVYAALSQTGGARMFLAPGCSMPPNTAPEYLAAVRDAVRRWSAEH